jgi:hypothetical protein
MRSRLVLLLACALALAAPASASAALTVGISENQPAMFADPSFQGLGVKTTRVVTAYDVALHPGSHEFNRVADYLGKAEAAGIEPLVTFEHLTGDASRCGQKRFQGRSVCKLPTTTAYEAAVKAFLTAFPNARTIAPWNEANHFTQPTSRSPKTAAKFTDIVAKNCPACTIVVADMLDQADDPAAKRPTFAKTAKYIRTFRSALKTKRGICGIHNYSDVNRFRSTGTAALVKALGCKEYWLTETGGLYKFGSFWSKRTYHGCNSASSCQVKATKYMFSLANRNKRIKRVYVYTWFAGVGARFDSGLVSGRTQRKALSEVRKHL